MPDPKLSFGYIYDLRNPPAWHRPWSELYAETLDLIAWTESVGFAGAWIPEHHLAEDGYIPAPNLILAAIAARTSTIRFGQAVALAPLYDPVRFAEECAVLDILSDGRLDVALGIGYRKREYSAFGVPFGKRGKRLDEFLQILRALWAGETVNFAGEHYQVENATIMPPAPRGGIPLYIGGFADKALDRVARHADGYFGNEEVFARYAGKLAAFGKDPASARIRIPDLFLAVARDPDAAFDELVPYYVHVNNSYGEWNAEDNALGLESGGLAAMDVAAFRQSGILKIMTPSESIDHFRALRARVPIEHLMMMRPPGLPADRFRDYARLFADEVIPAFA